MSKSELGWFGVGAVVGAAVALAKKGQHTLEEKILIVRDGSVVATTNADFEDDGDAQDWGEKAVKVTIKKDGQTLATFSDFKKVLLTIRDTASGKKFEISAKNKFRLGSLRYKLRLEKGSLAFKFDGEKHLLHDGEVLETLEIMKIEVTPQNGDAQPFPAQEGKRLAAEFRSAAKQSGSDLR